MYTQLASGPMLLCDEWGAFAGLFGGSPDDRAIIGLRGNEQQLNPPSIITTMVKKKKKEYCSSREVDTVENGETRLANKVVAESLVLTEAEREYRGTGKVDGESLFWLVNAALVNVAWMMLSLIWSPTPDASYCGPCSRRSGVVGEREPEEREKRDSKVPGPRCNRWW